MAQSTVFIVDHLPILRRALREALETAGDFVPVGEAADPGPVLEQAAAQRPDVVLLELRISEVAGSEALTTLAASRPPVVIALVEGKRSALRALADGARGVWDRTSDLERLVEAVRAAARGEIWVDPAAMAHLATELDACAAWEQRQSELTPAERHMLKLLGQGKSEPDIAAELHVSGNTVKSTVWHVMDKLDIHKRARLYDVAVEDYERSRVAAACVRALRTSGIFCLPAMRGGA